MDMYIYIIKVIKYQPPVIRQSDTNSFKGSHNAHLKGH